LVIAYRNKKEKEFLFSTGRRVSSRRKKNQ